MTLLTTNEVSSRLSRCDFLHALERIGKPLYRVWPLLIPMRRTEEITAST